MKRDEMSEDKKNLQKGTESTTQTPNSKENSQKDADGQENSQAKNAQNASGQAQNAEQSQENQNSEQTPKESQEAEHFTDDPYNELFKESMRLGGIGVEKLDFDLLAFRTEYTIDTPPQSAQNGEQNPQNAGQNAQNQNSQNAQNSQNNAKNSQNPQAKQNAKNENAEKTTPKKPDFKPNFKALSEKELSIFDDDELFLNENLKIRQSYKLEIYETKTRRHIQNPRVKLILNKDITKLIAEIDFSPAVMHPNIAMHTLQAIYKKMIKEGFFIGIRIFDFKKDLLAALNAFKNGTLHRPKVKIEVATGVHPVSPEAEKLILSYLDKAKNQDATIQKVSVIGVSTGELILRHIAPGAAKRGRGLKFDYIEPHLPPQSETAFDCSENFERKEVPSDNEKVRYMEYYAKKKGFVTRAPDGKFDIENELNLTSATFKETGAILGGLDNNITVNIKSSSDLEDAVGSGVFIECETLVVNGNVGSNTNLRAKSVKIYGNTNTTAKIFAKDDAYISTHKGHLQAKRVDIDSLENGSVEAKIIKIKKGMGGKIDGAKIQIASLGSNNTINFAEMLIIEQCSGTNNKLTAQLFAQENAVALAMRELEMREKELPRLIRQTQGIIEDSRFGIDKLMLKIRELKAKNLPVPPNFSQMMAEFKAYSEHLNALKAELATLKVKKTDLSKELLALDEELYDAKIINLGKTWEDMNVIRWRLGHSECSYMPKRGEEAVHLFVKRHFDSKKMVIECSQEFEERDLEWLKE